jgi:hypothetical protein
MNSFLSSFEDSSPEISTASQLSIFPNPQVTTTSHKKTREQPTSFQRSKKKDITRDRKMKSKKISKLRMNRDKIVGEEKSQTIHRFDDDGYDPSFYLWANHLEQDYSMYIDD